MTEVRQVQSAVRKHCAALMNYPNVVAVGVGYKQSRGKAMEEPAVCCSVTKKLPLSELHSRAVIPRLVEGCATDVIETGTIRALRTGRMRPAPGGVSIGHKAITAGTLGCLVQRRGETVILSNNHVLANSNDALIGDAILQPGPIDGGRPGVDNIATLLDYVPIDFDMPEPPSDCKFARAVIAMLNAGCRAIGSKTRYRITRPKAGENRVDAAVARVMDSADVLDQILNIGKIQGVAEALLGQGIKKAGRTTGFTTGSVLQTNVTVDVDYGNGRVARFVDQFMGGDMSAGGDSGSAVVNDDDELVGLLFAGSQTTTIFNHIDNVFLALGVTRL